MLVPLLIAFESLVAGETCPAPADVEARVRTILHLRPEQELSESFAVERHESGLYVELRSADRGVIGQRTLPAEGTCDELAQASAVVLSAWLSDVHPDFAGALPPAPPPEPAPAPPPIVPAATAAPATAPAPPSAPVSSPPLPARRLELGLAAGIDLAVSGGNLAATGSLVADYALPARGWGVSGFASATWPRELALGPGTAAWRRWPVGLGPNLRFGTGFVRWDVSAGPALGWLHLSGTNFDRTSSQDGLSWGGFLSLRASSRGRRAGVFGLANAQLFPGEIGASAAKGKSPQEGQWQARLPSLSLGLAVGAWVAP